MSLQLLRANLKRKIFCRFDFLLKIRCLILVMSGQNLQDLIEETVVILQKLLIAFKGEGGEDEYSLELSGSEVHSARHSKTIEAIDKILEPKEKKMTLILKFPNCENCDDEKKTEMDSTDNDIFKTINSGQLSPSSPIETFISGLMSPTHIAVEKKFDTFQGKFDDFSQNISERLEALSERIGSLESSNEHKSQKPKHK